MRGKLEGKTALITGASRGIGRAIAEKFAREGATFIGAHYGNNEAGARDAVSRIKALGAKAVALQAELTGGKAGADKLWNAFEAAAAKDGGCRAPGGRIVRSGRCRDHRWRLSLRRHQGGRALPGQSCDLGRGQTSAVQDALRVWQCSLEGPRPRVVVLSVSRTLIGALRRTP